MDYIEELITIINDIATNLFYEETGIKGSLLFQIGGCYELYLILSKITNNTTLYINRDKEHVVTKYKNRLYDSGGRIIYPEEYTKATIEDYIYVEKNFGKAFEHLHISESVLEELSKKDINELLEKLQKQKVLIK